MMKIRSIALATILGLSACAPEFEDGDEHFFVHHKGATMPVWVTGNWRSNRIILHVHGGPGTTNAIYWQKSSYQQIADEVGIAYYEQRGSGAAQGNRRENISVDQFVEDLETVLTVLEDRYPDAEFVLAGHSWGGHLGSKFISEPTRAARVQGWINQSGVVDASCRSWNWGRDQVLATARRVLSGSPPDKEKEFWEGAQAFYADVWRCDEQTQANNLYDQHEGKTVELNHSLYVRAASGYDVDPEKVLNGEETLQLLFNTHYDLVAVPKFSPLQMEGYIGTNLIPEMAGVQLPTAVLWGTYDVITPWVNAKPIYESHGAAEHEKMLVMFENSGHNPWAEEPDKFYQAVHDFLVLVWPELDQ